MNRNGAIKKQVIAFLLAAVFVFIHVGKVLHTHENKAYSDAGCKTEQVTKSAECTVCDFDFTKDTEHHAVTPLVSKLPFRLQEFLSYQSRTTSSIGLNYADRGPPALA